MFQPFKVSGHPNISPRADIEIAVEQMVIPQHVAEEVLNDSSLSTIDPNPSHS
jgi:hypothetical protein